MGLRIEQNVHRLLIKRDWTIYRLSKESGVSLTVLYNLGKKKQGPTAETLIKVAKALDITLDELIK